jgi:hypothetical protein
MSAMSTGVAASMSALLATLVCDRPATNVYW